VLVPPDQLPVLEIPCQYACAEMVVLWPAGWRRPLPVKRNEQAMCYLKADEGP